MENDQKFKHPVCTRFADSWDSSITALEPFHVNEVGFWGSLIILLKTVGARDWFILRYV